MNGKILLAFIPCGCLSLFAYAPRDSTATKTAAQLEETALSGLVYNTFGGTHCNRDCSVVPHGQPRDSFCSNGYFGRLFF